MRLPEAAATLLSLLAFLALGPAAAAAEGRFELPPISAWEPDPARGEVIIVDDATGKPARVALGDDYRGRYRLVEVERDRIVLRRLGDEAIYIVLPTEGETERERGDREPRRQPEQTPPEEVRPDRLSPIDPYRQPDAARPGVAPERARARRDDRRPPSHRREHDRDDREIEPAPRDPRAHERHRRQEDARLRQDAPSPPQAERRARERRPEPHWQREPLELSRAALDGALADLDELRRDVTIRAEDSGLRIASLRRNSFVAGLGLRAGDLVRRVAGRRLDSPEAAAALYAHLARADSFTVELEREGRELVLHYRLVP